MIRFLKLSFEIGQSFYMMNMQFSTKYLFGNSAPLAGVMISPANGRRNFAPVLTIKRVTPATPSWVLIARHPNSVTFCEALTGAVLKHNPLYLVWLAVKLLATGSTGNDKALALARQPVFTLPFSSALASTKVVSVFSTWRDLFFFAAVIASYGQAGMKAFRAKMVLLPFGVPVWSLQIHPARATNNGYKRLTLALRETFTRAELGSREIGNKFFLAVLAYLFHGVILSHVASIVNEAIGTLQPIARARVEHWQAKGVQKELL